MRFVKFLVAVVLFVVTIVFFYQNAEIFNTGIEVKLDLYGLLVLQSKPLPLYLVILSTFALGCVLTMIYFLADKIRSASALRECKTRMAGLEQEVNSLRNMPLDNQGYVAVEDEVEEE